MCNNGTETWYIDDKDTNKQITKTLLENGFPLINLQRDKNYVYAKIDYTRMKLQNFYLWDQINPKDFTEPKDVWRIFNIPNALWSCPIFKEHYWSMASLPPCVTTDVLTVLTNFT